MGVKPNNQMDNRRRKRTSQKEDRGIERVSVTFTYPGKKPEVRASFQHLRLFSCFDLILNNGAEPRASHPFTEITLREGVNHNYLAAKMGNVLGTISRTTEATINHNICNDMFVLCESFLAVLWEYKQ